MSDNRECERYYRKRHKVRPGFPTYRIISDAGRFVDISVIVVHNERPAEPIQVGGMTVSLVLNVKALIAYKTKHVHTAGHANLSVQTVCLHRGSTAVA